MDSLGDIISSLSQKDIETLQSVASSVLGDDAEKESAKTVETGLKSNDVGSFLNSFSPSDINTLMKMKNTIEMMNKKGSKNVDLINALKPLLSEKSQKRADEAIKILRLFEMLPLIKDMFKV